MEKAEAGAWLAGFVDGEGCVYAKKAQYRGREQIWRSVIVSNTEKSLIDYAARCLRLLGIRNFRRFDRMPGKGALGKRRCYSIQIGHGPDLWRFREYVPIKHKEKRKRLNLLLTWYTDLRCKGCGCLRDERTEDCVHCDARPRQRDRFIYRLPAASPLGSDSDPTTIFRGDITG